MFLNSPYCFSEDTFLDKYSLVKKGTGAKVIKEADKKNVIITLPNDPFKVKYKVSKKLLVLREK